MQPGIKASVRYSPTNNFTQEASAIVTNTLIIFDFQITNTEHGPFRCLVSRSVYEDDDSCLEAVVCVSISSIMFLVRYSIWYCIIL